MEIVAKYRNKIIFSFIFGFAVMAVIAILGDFNQMLRVLGNFQWILLLPILGLTTINYTARFLKWHYYLKVVGNGAEQIKPGDSAVIFIGGMSMAMTPGKMGEFLKSYLVNQLNNTPMMVTAPIVIVERVSDGIAMLILASAGVFFFENLALRLALLTLLVATVMLFVLVQWRWLALRIIDYMGRMPLLARRMTHMHSFYESSYKLFNPQSTLVGVGLGLVGWSCECTAFYLVMLGLGFEGTLLLLIQCTFILATSTIVGSVTMLPGGLGAIDSSIGGLLLVSVKAITAATASAGTLLIRFCTLWFGVSLGLVTLLVFRKRFQSPTGYSPVVARPEASAAPRDIQTQARSA